MRRVVFLLCAICLVAATAGAQDPVKVDAKHYKVEFENAQVRVLRAHYGPHEKSVMHEHPDTVAVFVTDLTAKFTFPDGKTEDSKGKAGQTMWTKAGKHLPENTGDKAFDVIVIEMKGKAAPAAKPAAPAPKKKS
jgi:quercetin dioxygenase-like cupin family protein